MDYISVKHDSIIETEDKKSKFIAHVSHVETEHEAAEFINNIKKQHYNASHNVYAFILRENNFKKYSDDGEPSRTAGYPILEMLQKENITDVVCVVTRYFGGTLLGTGGLIRAYTHAAKEGIAAAEILKKVKCDIVKISADYTFLSKLEHILKTGGYKISDKLYKEDVILTVISECEKTDKLFSDVESTLGINIDIKKDGITYN